MGKQSDPKEYRRGDEHLSAIERLDRELAASALRKGMAGEAVNGTERAALRRVERAKEEMERWRHYGSVPKKHYLGMSGRQARTVNDQASTYGMPVGGPVVDLGKLVRWLHDFLRENARRLARDEDEADVLGGGDSPELNRLRGEWLEERILLERQKRRAGERTLVPRDSVHEGLGRIAGIIRGLGERLERQFGGEAHRLLDEALDDAEGEIGRLFGGEGVGDGGSGMRGEKKRMKNPKRSGK